ncbi:hypothetical protein Gohar_024755, partial [Gossypium harknessii]|nr:hypothetical protein [Gossypium harknessii]
FFWKEIWKLDTLSKICVFTWRVGNEILPTNVKITSVRRGFDQASPRCDAKFETHLQALKDCSTSRTTLMIGSLDGNIISKGYDRGID